MIDDTTNQKNVKIFALVIAVIFIIIVSLIIFINYSKFNNFLNPTYLVVDNDLIWKKDNNTWISATKDDIAKKINFKIYFDKTNVKEGKINFYSASSFVKERGTFRYVEKDFEAAISNGTLSIADIHTTNIDNINNDADANAIFINSLNEEEREQIYNNYQNRIFGQKIKVDINNDNKNENIYILNSLTKDSTSFSYSNISLVTNDTVQNIVNSGTYYYDVKKIIDIDNDNKYEIIVKKSKYKDSSEYCYELYKNEDGIYKKEKSCSLN